MARPEGDLPAEPTIPNFDYTVTKGLQMEFGPTELTQCDSSIADAVKLLPLEQRISLEVV